MPKKVMPPQPWESLTPSMELTSWVWRRLGRVRWLLVWLFSPKYCIGVSAIILNEQGYVWLQQHRFWKDQSWGLPGGLIGSSELPAQALVREMYEETGRSITIERLFEAQLFFRRGLSLCYVARMGDEPLQLDVKEIIQAGFYSIKSLPEPLLPDHRLLIQSYNQQTIT